MRRDAGPPVAAPPATTPPASAGRPRPSRRHGRRARLAVHESAGRCRRPTSTASIAGPSPTARPARRRPAGAIPTVAADPSRRRPVPAPARYQPPLRQTVATAPAPGVTPVGVRSSRTPGTPGPRPSHAQTAGAAAPAGTRDPPGEGRRPSARVASTARNPPTCPPYGRSERRQAGAAAPAQAQIQRPRPGHRAGDHRDRRAPDVHPEHGHRVVLAARGALGVPSRRRARGAARRRSPSSTPASPASGCTCAAPTGRSRPTSGPARSTRTPPSRCPTSPARPPGPTTSSPRSGTCSRSTTPRARPTSA